MKNNFNFAIFFYALFLFSFFNKVYTSKKGCGHDMLVNKFLSKKELINNLIKDNSDEDEGLVSYEIENTFRPLRLYIDSSYLDTSKNQAVASFIKNRIMKNVKKVFEKMLKVKRIINPLKFDQKKCSDVDIPSYLNKDGVGVDADIIIIATLDETGYFRQERIEAAAIHCVQNKVNGRPVLGFIQFQEELLFDDSTEEYMVWLAIHEITHVLGMSKQLYTDFIDANGKKLEYSSLMVEEYNEQLGKKITYLKTPKVLEKAREHFNCPSLIGVPMEYNGGQGTVGSHWSKRYMNTEYMIGDSYGENLLSSITLALFEDSGWYLPDYTTSNLFLWGKDKGCDFFKNNCAYDKDDNNFKSEILNNEKSLKKSNLKRSNSNKINTKAEAVNNNTNKLKSEIKSKMSSQYNVLHFVNKDSMIPVEIATPFNNEFCTKPNKETCSISHLFRGVCLMQNYVTPLPDSTRYFKNDHFGGVDNMTDKCPISIEIKEERTYGGGSCRIGNKLKEIEKICPECACFMSSLSQDNLSEMQSNDLDATCFEYKCSLNNKLQIVLDNNYYDCNGTDETRIPGYSGFVKCPDSKILCDSKYKCKWGCTD